MSTDGEPYVDLTPPSVGATAPDAVLSDDTGQPVRISACWTAAPRGLVLVFIRQFG